VHLWTFIFYNAQFSWWWSYGDLVVKEASICLKCFKAFQLQATQCQAIFVLFYVFIFLFQLSTLWFYCFWWFFSFLTWNIVSMELLTLCFHDLHKFSDNLFSTSNFPNMFFFHFKTRLTYQLARYIMLLRVETLMTRVQFPHNVVSSFLAMFHESYS
jgi:hypothetical protein